MRWSRLALALAVLTLLICGDISHAQVTQVAHSFCATDQACSWGALNTFSSGISLPSLPNGCLSTTSGLVNSQACGLPLTGGTLTGLLNGTIFTASTVITAPQFCIGNSCITAWPASSAPAGTNSLQYSNSAGTALLALPNASAGSWLASTSATTAPAMQTKPVLDARDFGTPNGSNAGTLIQAAHDSAKCPSTGCVIDARGFGATDTIAGLSITKPVEIDLGATNFSVTATISYTAVQSPILKGCGGGPQHGCTTLTWAGNNSTSMIDLNGVFKGVFSDFYMKAPGAANSLTAFFTAEENVTGLSSGNALSNIWGDGNAGSVVDGFRWQIGSGGDANNDQFTFTNVAFANYSNACFNNDGSTQSQIHSLYKVNCSGNGYGKYRWYGQGSFSDRDQFSGTNTVTDYQITYPNTGVLIQGGISIGSTRFYVDGPNTASVNSVHIDGVQLAAMTAVDGKIIELGGGGPYKIENVQGYGSSAVPYQFYYNVPGYGLPSAVAENNTFASSLANPLTCYAATGCWQGSGNVVVASPGYTDPVSALLANSFIAPLILGSPYAGINGELDLRGSNNGSFPITVSPVGDTVNLGPQVSVNNAGLVQAQSVRIAQNLNINSGPQLISSGFAQASGPTQFITNTTGATLFVALISSPTACTSTFDQPNGPYSSNTWNYLTCYNDGTNYVRWGYVYAPTTSPVHVFNYGESSPQVPTADSSVIYWIVSGTLTTSGVYDTSTGTSSSLSSPLQPGSIMVSAVDAVFVGCVNQYGGGAPPANHTMLTASVNDAFSPAIITSGYYNEQAMGASLMSASAGALNPTITFTATSPAGGCVPAIAAFKAAVTTPPTVTMEAGTTVTMGGAPTGSVLAVDGSGYLPGVTAGTPTVGQTACIKSAGPPVVIGYCSTVVGSGGACTCN